MNNVRSIWTSTGQAAVIGIFLILFGAFLYVGRAIVLPTSAAAVIALTLAPLIRVGQRRGISPWIMGVLIVLLGFGALSLGAMVLAGPVSEWIGRAPEIGTTIKERLSVLELPFAALRELETTHPAHQCVLKEI